MTDIIDATGRDVSGDAYERHKRIVELRDAVEMCFLELGEQLYWFEKERQYEALGYLHYSMDHATI